MRLLEQGCQDGAASACIAPEVNHVGFHGAARNEAKAVEVYERACEGRIAGPASIQPRAAATSTARHTMNT